MALVVSSEWSLVADKLTCVQVLWGYSDRKCPRLCWSPVTGSQSFPGLLLNAESPLVRSISTERGRSGGESKITTLTARARAKVAATHQSSTQQGTLRMVARCNRWCSRARSSFSEERWLWSRSLSADIWAPSWKGWAPGWSPLVSGGAAEGVGKGGAAAGRIARVGKSGKQCGSNSEEPWNKEGRSYRNWRTCSKRKENPHNGPDCCRRDLQLRTRTPERIPI